MLFYLFFSCVLLLFVIWAITFIYTAKRGSPYVPIKPHRLETIAQFIKPGNHVADLGAGDGRILIEAVKRGASLAEGWESDLGVYLLGLYRIRKSRVDRSKIKFHFGDFWFADLKQVDLVYVYQMTKYLKPMKQKIISQLKPGTLIVSPDYEIPGQKLFKKITDADRGLYVYQA